jgi:hypothetical protein
VVQQLRHTLCAGGNLAQNPEHGCDSLETRTLGERDVCTGMSDTWTNHAPGIWLTTEAILQIFQLGKDLIIKQRIIDLPSDRYECKVILYCKLTCGYSTLFR